MGLPTYNWLGDPAIALKGIMIMNIWSTALFFMVIYLAALQDIPQTLYEAAKLDRADGWRQFIYNYPSLAEACNLLCGGSGGDWDFSTF